MPDHQTPLIATIAAGLVLAYCLGLVAHRLRIQPLVGYLAAGVVIGPFTPGFTADQKLAAELAEIGVMLLMFGVGLHFSFKGLASVARIAVPGAIVRMVFGTLLGAMLAYGMGWHWSGGLVFGLALSVASTVVLVRALQERHLVNTRRGQIAIGWLVVEDIAMVLVLVLIPVLASATRDTGITWSGIGVALATAFAKIAALLALMTLIGRLLVPGLMHYTAQTGSRELFRLAVYAIAFGAAFSAAHWFGASLALGAFFAGMLLGETKLSQRAAEEAMPLRDAFAVLFFVSVGMLFDPTIVIRHPGAIAATTLVIVVGKSLIAYAMLRLSGINHGDSLSITASLAQIGEFSFILLELGVGQALLPPESHGLVLAGAILSILINPVLFSLAERWRNPVQAAPAAQTPAPQPPVPQPSQPRPAPEVEEPRIATTLSGHDVLVGFGQIGSVVGGIAKAAGHPLFVIEARDETVSRARSAGIDVAAGNAAEGRMLQLANLPHARRLFVTIADPFEAGQVVQQARALMPQLEIHALAYSDEAADHLAKMGASIVVRGEKAIADRMILDALANGGPAPPRAVH